MCRCSGPHALYGDAAGLCRLADEAAAAYDAALMGGVCAAWMMQVGVLLLSELVRSCQQRRSSD